MATVNIQDITVQDTLESRIDKANYNFKNLLSACTAPTTSSGNTYINNVDTTKLPKITADKANGIATFAVTNYDSSFYTVTVKDGADGKNGTDGKDGVDGKDGADGKDGITPELLWGNITGDIDNQTDLSIELDAKVPTVASIPLDYIDGLV